MTENVTYERAQIIQWRDAPIHTKVSLFEAGGTHLQQLYLQNLNFNKYFVHSLSGLVTFFKALHTDPCDNCNNSSNECVAGPLQRRAYQIMGLFRMSVLAYQCDDLPFNGWGRLITSIADAKLQAEAVFEMRHEYVRIRALEELDAETRNKIFDNITELQAAEYPTMDGDCWYCVMVPAYAYLEMRCVYCKEGYNAGQTVVNKACKVHTCHQDCATKLLAGDRSAWVRCDSCDPNSRCMRWNHLIKFKLEA